VTADGWTITDDPLRIEYGDRNLYVYESLLSEKFGQLIVSRLGLRVLVFDQGQEKILKWIESMNTVQSSGE